jgi:hypothetical protein
MTTKVAATLVLASAICFAQIPAPRPGVIHLYRTGASTGGTGLGITVDGQKVYSLKNGHVVDLPVTPGDHEVECNLVAGRPTVKTVHVEAGGNYHIVLDYERMSMFHLLASSDPTHGISVSLDRSAGVPEGNFHQDVLSADEAEKLLAPPQIGLQKPLLADARDLTDEEVADAVTQGKHDNSSDSVGLFLDDQTTAFVSRVVDSEQGISGFSLRLYTASQWIELHAAEAHRLLKPFTLADVDPEWRKNRLYVVGLPSTPDHLTGTNISASSSVQHIVLLGMVGTDAIQPLDESPITLTLDSALRSKDYGGIEASFPRPDLTQEFRIAVIGEGGSRKIFIVKKKYLNRLR